MYNTTVIRILKENEESDGIVENLYKPSLTGNDIGKTRSYDISNLFFVAMFGGLFAMAAVGLQNAKWLKIEKKYIQLLTIISIVLIIAKVAVIYAIGQQIIAIDEKSIIVVDRIFGIACFFIFFVFLNKPYKEHLAVDGGTELLRKSGFITLIDSSLLDALVTIFLLVL